MFFAIAVIRRPSSPRAASLPAFQCLACHLRVSLFITLASACKHPSLLLSYMKISVFFRDPLTLSRASSTRITHPMRRPHQLRMQRASNCPTVHHVPSPLLRSENCFRNATPAPAVVRFAHIPNVRLHVGFPSAARCPAQTSTPPAPNKLLTRTVLNAWRASFFLNRSCTVRPISIWSVLLFKQSRDFLQCPTPGRKFGQSLILYET